MGLFNIVFSNLPQVLLPVRLRTPSHKGWLKALIQGAIEPLYNIFYGNRAANVYTMQHNGQVCYLKAALNDMFDNADRRIYITDVPYCSAIFVYLDSEIKPVYTALDSEVGATSYAAPKYAYTEVEINASVSGFIVWVPVALAYDVVRLKALVNKYRLPGMKNWIIRTF